MSLRHSSLPVSSQLSHAAQLPPPPQRGFAILLILLIIVLAGMVFLTVYMLRLDSVVRSKFEGKRWEIPAKVYARPMELYPQETLSAAALENHLKVLGYRKSATYTQPGTYSVSKGDWFIHTRGFDFGTSQTPAQVIKLHFMADQISDIQSTQPTSSGRVSLEPLLIGGIYPHHNEDRVLIKLNEVPRPLIEALVATEDHNFFNHHGVSIRGTARAILSNAQGGHRQGGSTLTQQLVKNFYLTPERTIKRKVNEALMAILLELHYSKNEILETYMNEINLGQNGNHSINGFGLAAEFFFGKPLQELNLQESALLVGMVKGPSQYNPWRHPEDALARRNIVLSNMQKLGFLTAEQVSAAQEKPLGIVKSPAIGRTLYPDFLNVVRKQLSTDYQEADLSSDGLRIFTTLDPMVQDAANNAFNQSVAALEKSNPKRLGGIQGSMVVASPQTGELLAVVGGSGLFTGYNRALEAQRQIGSLVKPAIYLSALESQRYTLISPLNDDPVSITGLGMKDWAPQNYDRQSHGVMPMYEALAHSYNQATVRLGWELGLPAVMNTLSELGIQQDIKPYPSMLLGAINLSPMQVLGMYQTYSNGGNRLPIRAIRSVVNAHNQLLESFAVGGRQSIAPAEAYLINYALQQVVKSGTASAASKQFSPELNLAGKTGTTNDARDAWFAGYSGNYVAVVWLGHDDNRPIGLSGGTGALPVWMNLMKRLPLEPVNLTQPVNIQWTWVDYATGQMSAQGCPGAIWVPMSVSNLPANSTTCALTQSGMNPDVSSDPYASGSVDGVPDSAPSADYIRRVPDFTNTTDRDWFDRSRDAIVGSGSWSDSNGANSDDKN